MCPLLVYLPDLSQKSCFGTCYVFVNNSSFQNQHFLVCFRQSGTIKLTVWTVGSYYNSGKKTHFVGETLPKKSKRRIYHFSSYLIINSFLCKYMAVVFFQNQDIALLQNQDTCTYPQKGTLPCSCVHVPCQHV